MKTITEISKEFEEAWKDLIMEFAKSLKIDKLCDYLYNLNLPFSRIHDSLSSYGYILFPLFWLKKDVTLNRIKWLAYFDNYGFRITDKYGFHNCTRTGVF